MRDCTYPNGNQDEGNNTPLGTHCYRRHDLLLFVLEKSCNFFFYPRMKYSSTLRLHHLLDFVIFVIEPSVGRHALVLMTFRLKLSIILQRLSEVRIHSLSGFVMFFFYM